MQIIRENHLERWDLSTNSWQSCFSNFTPGWVDVQMFDIKLRASTAEHAYQALKSTDEKVRTGILNCHAPSIAKSAGRRLRIRDDWYDGIRMLAMLLVVSAKFDQHPKFRHRLAETGMDPIIEVTYWNDTYWGTNLDGVGANVLGQILMLVRSTL